MFCRLESVLFQRAKPKPPRSQSLKSREGRAPMRHAPVGGVVLRPKKTYVEVGKFALDKLLYNIET